MRAVPDNKNGNADFVFNQEVVVPAGGVPVFFYGTCSLAWRNLYAVTPTWEYQSIGIKSGKKSTEYIQGPSDWETHELINKLEKILELVSEDPDGCWIKLIRQRNTNLLDAYYMAEFEVRD